MSFWTEPTLEPKRNFRFKITSDFWDNSDSVWWWAKSIDKPSFNVTNNEYQLINHKFKYPGIVTWNNIQITLVDFDAKKVDLIVVKHSSNTFLMLDMGDQIKQPC